MIALPVILISCGEPSGDLYAGALTAALRDLDPGARVFGLGGDRLRAGGAELTAHYRGLAATGLSEALAVVPRSFAVYGRDAGHLNHVLRNHVREGQRREAADVRTRREPIRNEKGMGCPLSPWRRQRVQSPPQLLNPSAARPARELAAQVVRVDRPRQQQSRPRRSRPDPEKSSQQLTISMAVFCSLRGATRTCPGQPPRVLRAGAEEAGFYRLYLACPTSRPVCCAPAAELACGALS